ERVLLQEGVFSRQRRDIPLGRINDHAMSQRFVERMLGCGTLTIESAGERGQSVLAAVPGVEKVQTTLYELVEADRDKHTVGDGELREILDK
ncbi:MAG TPA: PH domain-containing protein, partial [Micromonospora sp.]